MNKNKKYIVIGSLSLIILITGFSLWGLNNKKDLQVIVPLEQNQITDNLDKETKKREDVEIIKDINTIKVSLIVLDKKYETNIKERSSVFEAMEKMQKENTQGNIFDFKYTHNASLGNFITEINGQYGTPGKYWIYYVNNEKASIGVSNYILKDGDIISWSQEGI
jgi:hypothetical protein